MNKQPIDFKRISQKEYADFALELGLSSSGMYLIVDGRTVGWRTSGYVYVDPDVYNQVMSKPSYTEYYLPTYPHRTKVRK